MPLFNANRTRMPKQNHVMQARLLREFFELEGRVVPAADQYKWFPPDITSPPPLVWTEPTNWYIKVGDEFNLLTTVPGATVPGADDIVYFNDEGNKDCIVNDPVAVHAMRVMPGYNSKITIQNTLTIVPAPAGTWPTAAATPASVLSLNSSQAKLGGTPAGTTNLNIGGGSEFNWTAGVLENVRVTIGSGGVDAQMNVQGASGGAGPTVLTMHGTAIDIDRGRLKWVSGNVNVTNGTSTATEISSINVGANGVFEILASHTWGTAAGITPLNFAVQNNGLTTKSGGDATLRANFLNMQDVRVDSGTLTFGGKAEQTAGTFEIASGATAKMTGTGQVLRIYDGLIGGAGTVDGNLTLGYDGNSGPCAPVLRAGPVNGFGNLTVKQSFHIFSDCATVMVKVGDCDLRSQLVVLGDWAVLNGSIDITWANADPPERIEHVLVDIRGNRLQEFYNNFFEDGRIGNQGVTFKTTYLGGNGNDVSLIPWSGMAGKVWFDWNRNAQEDNTLGPEGGWSGVKVTLTGGNLAAPIVVYTDAGGGYNFGEFRADAGVYTLTVTPPQYMSVTTANATQTIDLTDESRYVNGAYAIQPVGVALPFMELTISGMSGVIETANGPLDTSIFNDTWTLPFVSFTGDNSLLWRYVLPFGSQSPFTIAFEFTAFWLSDEEGNFYPPLVNGRMEYILLNGGQHGGSRLSFYGYPAFTAFSPMTLEFDFTGTTQQGGGGGLPEFTSPGTLTFTPLHVTYPV